MAARIGYSFSPAKGLRLHAEPFFYRTTHILLPEDEDKYDATRLAYGLQLAAVYHF